MDETEVRTMPNNPLEKYGPEINCVDQNNDGVIDGNDEV